MQTKDIQPKLEEVREWVGEIIKSETATSWAQFHWFKLNEALCQLLEDESRFFVFQKGDAQLEENTQTDIQPKLKEVREWARGIIQSKTGGPGGHLYCLKLNETLSQILESMETPYIALGEANSRPKEPLENVFRPVV